MFISRVFGADGPINGWDRTAYISTVKYGTPSYEAEMNHVAQNFIIANYGSSQGFDTDDGTSWCEFFFFFFSFLFFSFRTLWFSQRGGNVDGMIEWGMMNVLCSMCAVFVNEIGRKALT